MACRAAAWALLLSLVLAIGGPAVAAVGAASDISLKDVSVSVVESGGSTSSTHEVTGPTAGVQLVLDHTRTVKVRTARWRTPAALVGDGWGWGCGNICLHSFKHSTGLHVAKPPTPCPASQHLHSGPY